MKIKYEFADGKIEEVEVSTEIGEMIIGSRREENTKERRERRHCYSLDAIHYEGKVYANNQTPEMLILQSYRDKQIEDALDKLSEVQRKRLMLYADGLSYREIAELEGVSHKSVEESVNAARKKFLKFF